MLSIARIAAPHFGQRDRPAATDSWRGKRAMHTFRKLPKTSPSSPQKIPVNKFNPCTGKFKFSGSIRGVPGTHAAIG